MTVVCSEETKLIHIIEVYNPPFEVFRVHNCPRSEQLISD